MNRKLVLILFSFSLILVSLLRMDQIPTVKANINITKAHKDQYSPGLSPGYSPQQQTDTALVKRYAPVLYFHPDEVFRPQPVEVLLEQSRLRKDRSLWFDLNLINNVNIPDLLDHNDDSLFLDVWYGTPGESDYKNFSAHRSYYAENLSPFSGGPPISVYATVKKDQGSQNTILQYWLFYYYNDWFNKHEGDWELVQIVLDHDQEPEWVVLSQHHGGTRRRWEDVRKEDGAHPAVYVALGSHANYFWGNEIYPNGMEIGNDRVEILDRTGESGRVIPKIILSPAIDQIPNTEETFSTSIWVVFSGRWGEMAVQSDFGGPLGPAAKGDQWEKPFEWGMDQPLDYDYWYQNRLKIRSHGSQFIDFRIIDKPLMDAGNIDIGSNHFIYHDEPPDEIQIKFELSTTSEALLLISWPDKAAAIVDKFIFTGFNQGDAGEFIANFKAGENQQFLFDGEVVFPASQYTKKELWEAPDLVWFVGYLQASQITSGILIILAASIFPTILYTLLIYRLDPYEKEPANLLLTAFLWGAFPSVLLAIFAQLFFKLPPGLMGPEALEAIQLGYVSPFIEEALKGVVVIFIARRYRLEFNGVLDGIVYGAITGLGFAMTGNLISYAGSFLFRGFEGLGAIVFVEGILSGLNHAFYASIFGAGLGFYRESHKKKYSKWVPIGAYLIAVAVNSLHTLMRSNILNQPTLGFLINWIGIATIILIIFGAAKRQKNTIAAYLSDEIPASAVNILISSKSRRKQLRKSSADTRGKVKKTLLKQFNLLTHLAFAKKKNNAHPKNEFKGIIDSLKQKINHLDKETNFLGIDLSIDREQNGLQ